MTAFRSLIFRELRISRKQHILEAVATLIFALYFLMAAAVMKQMKVSDFKSYEDMMLNRESIVFMAAVMMGVLPVTLAVGQHNTLKADLNSGWLRYSYTLPIDPSVRAAVSVTIKLVTSVVGAIFAIACTCLYCSISELSFHSYYLVIDAAALALGALFSIPSDYIILSTRSPEELKKKTNLTGLMFTVVFLIPAYISVKRFFSSEHNFKDVISKLSPVMLVWMIPLIAALTAADYIVIRKRLSVPFSTFRAEKKPKTENRAVITDTHDYPTGFLYKELKQNRLNIVIILILPLLCLILNYAMVFVMSLDDSMGDFKTLFKTGEARVFYYLTTALGAYVASSMVMSVFSGDDRKLWAYFTVSTPQSVKGFMYYKYVFCFALNGAYMVGCIFTNSIYDTIYYAVTGRENNSFTMVIFIIFFLILFNCAADVPLMVRFGQKKGSIINTSIIMSVSMLAIVGFILLPEKAQDRVMKMFVSLRQGGGDKSLLIMSIVMLLILAGYVLSYKISCKLFMKGVNGYDK